ncbi:cache domain-containing protein [Pseudovibrio sp. Tun.PSC04-5.I4]|uniref:cache domain-containing protein n=1 Tax=Pseudovibrio sp. Tun.PSC04-5.I4 TaxID=1798213 RepID=UPI000B8462A1|nr:cache domain-containing protein [Pseudovibrio sp. Tun.PSC04-5.I4]
MKLSHRIVSASAAVLIVASALVISTTTYLNMKNSEADSRALFTSVASGLAVTAQDITKEAQVLSTTLAAAFAAEIQGGDSNRNSLADMTRAALQGTSDVLGVTVVLEPDVLGKDTTFVGNEYSTDAGRFAPYFYKKNGSIGFRTAGINKASAQDWYYKALRKKSQHITEPYTFDVGGKNTVSASITTPFFDAKGNSIGGVVVDIDFDKLKQKLGVCQTSCPPISCSVSDFGAADFAFRV